MRGERDALVDAANGCAGPLGEDGASSVSGWCSSVGDESGDESGAAVLDGEDGSELEGSEGEGVAKRECAGESMGGTPRRGGFMYTGGCRGTRWGT